MYTHSVAYGRNNTAAAPHWAEWDKPRFATQVQNFMVEYLKTAYSKCENISSYYDFDTTKQAQRRALVLRCRLLPPT
jgi:hypothetical protein